ncbi:hypothetical protein AGMMS4957_17670 [Bacteroidia bacterium]|nr:hypothetical protein AGMMS4957_17670 [Bacteroidia bacterium]
MKREAVPISILPKAIIAVTNKPFRIKAMGNTNSCRFFFFCHNTMPVVRTNPTINTPATVIREPNALGSIELPINEKININTLRGFPKTSASIDRLPIAPRL